MKARLKPVCQRTLRRQVLEYVPHTNRKAIVQEFFPTTEEQTLYDLVSDYLQRPNLFALPASQRQLMTLILRKLLASSTFAISATLGALSAKLETVTAAQEPLEIAPGEIAPDYESLDETEDEWADDDAPEKEERRYTPEELQHMSAEIADLKKFQSMAQYQEFQGRSFADSVEAWICRRDGEGCAEKSHYFYRIQAHPGILAQPP